MSSTQKNSTTPTFKEIILLTIPQMGLMLCHLLISMTDIWTAGKIDATSINATINIIEQNIEAASVQASLGVVSQIFALLMMITSFIASGCMATISQSLGSGLKDRANRYAGLIILLSATSGITVCLSAIFLQNIIFDLMQIANNLRPTLSIFFLTSCLGLPFYYILIMVNSIFRAYKKVWLPLCTLAIMAIGNVIGDLGFGLGYFGLPNYGADGIAWTTFACSVFGLISNFGLAIKYKIIKKSSFAPWKWNKKAMPYLFKVGMPAAFSQIITQLGSLTAIAIISKIPESTNILAGMNVGMRIHSILLFPLSALNMSIVIFSGHLLGSGNREILVNFGKKIAFKTGLLVTIPAFLLWFYRDPIINYFTEDPSVKEQALLFLTFSCIITPLSCTTSLLDRIFAGSGATVLPCKINAFTSWVVNIPLSWLLAITLGFGAMGIYSTMLIVRIITFALILQIFYKRKWLEYGLRKRTS